MTTIKEMEKKHGITVDKLMRNSVEILKGADDPRIEMITAYMQQQYKARVDAGKKPKRGEVDPEIMGASPLSPKNVYRRF